MYLHEHNIKKNYKDIAQESSSNNYINKKDEILMLLQSDFRFWRTHLEEIGAKYPMTTVMFNQVIKAEKNNYLYRPYNGF